LEDPQCDILSEVTVREELDLLLDGMSDAELRKVLDRIRLEETFASKALEFSNAMGSRSEFHDLVFREAMRLVVEQSAKRRADEEGS
jgi:hypothetical protein